MKKYFGKSISHCLLGLLVATNVFANKTTDRLAIYDRISKKLDSMNNSELEELLKTGHPIGEGIGGPVSFLEWDGSRIFVKRVRLSDLEKAPENQGSTSNLFLLPPYYQYGVGSAGFGTWRELSAHKMSTQWVRRGENPNFPLLYASRVLDRPNVPPRLDEAGVEKYIKYWNNSSAVRNRVHEIQNSTTDVVLFLEYIPLTLGKWFEEEGKKGEATTQAAIKKFESELFATTSFMNSQGMLHFDAHPWNILTDGDQFYISDFGLATSSEFELTNEERAFFEQHRDYDKAYMAMNLVGGILRAIAGNNQEQQNALLNEYATGGVVTELSNEMGTILKRYAPVAAIMTKFLDDVRKDKTTPYPAHELRQACIASGLIDLEKEERTRLEEQYLATQKALHAGGKETPESRLIKRAIRYSRP